MTSKRIQAKTETPSEMYDAAWSLHIVTHTHYVKTQNTVQLETS